MLTPQDKRVLEEIHDFLKKLASPSGLDEDKLHFVKTNARKYRPALENIITKL